MGQEHLLKKAKTAVIILSISIFSQLVLFSSPATALGDPWINAEEVIHDAFLLQFWDSNKIRRRYWDNKSEDLDEKTTILNVSDFKSHIGGAACVDFELVSVNEYMAGVPAGSTQLLPDFGAPVWSVSDVRDDFFRGIKSFQSSIAIRQENFDIHKVINPERRFFTENTVSNLKDFVGRTYDFVIEKGMRDLEIEVISEIQCANGLSIFNIRADRRR